MNLRGHWKYLSYVLRHKWYVFIECVRLGIIWRGIWHDWNKFLPREWFPYVHYFYPDGKAKARQDSSGCYKPTVTGDAAFEMAWLWHQKQARHHHQWWILLGDDGSAKLLPMSDTDRKEMLADWHGAGKAQGFGKNTYKWYVQNCRKMELHPETRTWIEEQLGLRTSPITGGFDDWHRAGGECYCSGCGLLYVDHPNHSEYDWLHVLCTGVLVKL